tara:strand:- start:568 stop:675 length:108 start_codon:yes stop_codon:yes gene_type:complete
MVTIINIYKRGSEKYWGVLLAIDIALIGIIIKYLI